MKRLIALAAVLTIPFLVSAFDWPVEERNIITTFGTNEGDHFAVGLRLAGKERAVWAADEGEVVYYWNEEQKQRALPCGLGNMVAIEHPKGLKSLYGHLEEFSFSSGEANNYHVGKGDYIGHIGGSGWTSGNQLAFALFDSDFHQIVNPLLVLPSVLDVNEPIIRNVGLRFGDTEVALENGLTIDPGAYNLTAEIFDPSEYANLWTPMAVFSISIFVNGSEVKKFVFEALQELDGRVIMRATEKSDFNEIYIEEQKMRLDKLDLISGKTSIEIIVRDYAGNETSRIYHFDVAG